MAEEKAPGALSDQDLEKVAGGIDADVAPHCPKCGSANVFKVYEQGYLCDACGHGWNTNDQLVIVRPG